MIRLLGVGDIILLTFYISTGLVDPSELLESIEEQIAKTNEEAFSRKEILERIEKWLAACEEESWLEDYNKVNMTRIRDREILLPTFSSHCKQTCGYS